MNDFIQYNLPVKIIFGENKIKNLIDEVDGKKVFIVMDSFLFNSQLKNDVDEILVGKMVMYFTEFSSNPDYQSVNNALERIRRFEATTVVGIGGGSTLDISKLLSIAINENDYVENIIKNGFVTNSKIKSICIPTTAGTGSEVTNVSVISNYLTMEKHPFVHDKLFTDTAILDPNLTLTLPKAVTASCGMDTFCHSIEAFWNINSNDISDMFAVKSMKLVLNNLEKCYMEGTNIEYRKNMLKASLYAGIAFSQTRTTILHAVSFPLTSKFKIPHGLACSMLLPKFIKYYGKDNLKIINLTKELGYLTIDEFAVEVEKLMLKMKMNINLNSYGINEDDIADIANLSMQEKISTLGPKEVNADLLREMLKEIM